MPRRKSVLTFYADVAGQRNRGTRWNTGKKRGAGKNSSGTVLNRHWSDRDVFENFSPAPREGATKKNYAATENLPDREFSPRTRRKTTIKTRRTPFADETHSNKLTGRYAKTQLNNSRAATTINRPTSLRIRMRIRIRIRAIILANWSGCSAIFNMEFNLGQIQTRFPGKIDKPIRKRGEINWISRIDIVRVCVCRGKIRTP